MYTFINVLYRIVWLYDKKIWKCSTISVAHESLRTLSRSASIEILQKSQRAPFKYLRKGRAIAARNYSRAYMGKRSHGLSLHHSTLPTSITSTSISQHFWAALAKRDATAWEALVSPGFRVKENLCTFWETRQCSTPTHNFAQCESLILDVM